MSVQNPPSRIVQVSGVGSKPDGLDSDQLVERYQGYEEGIDAIVATGEFTNLAAGGEDLDEIEVVNRYRDNIKDLFEVADELADDENDLDVILCPGSYDMDSDFSDDINIRQLVREYQEDLSGDELTGPTEIADGFFSEYSYQEGSENDESIWEYVIRKAESQVLDADSGVEVFDMSTENDEGPDVLEYGDYSIVVGSSAPEPPIPEPDERMAGLYDISAEEMWENFESSDKEKIVEMLEEGAEEWSQRSSSSGFLGSLSNYAEAASNYISSVEDFFSSIGGLFGSNEDADEHEEDESSEEETEEQISMPEGFNYRYIPPEYRSDAHQEYIERRTEIEDMIGEARGEVVLTGHDMPYMGELPGMDETDVYLDHQNNEHQGSVLTRDVIERQGDKISLLTGGGSPNFGHRHYETEDGESVDMINTEGGIADFRLEEGKLTHKSFVDTEGARRLHRIEREQGEEALPDNISRLIGYLEDVEEDQDSADLVKDINDNMGPETAKQVGSRLVRGRRAT
jgi:hypothetical protein